MPIDPADDDHCPPAYIPGYTKRKERDALAEYEKKLAHMDKPKDLLQRAIKKARMERLDEEFKNRFHEKFPFQHKNQQMNWVLRQLVCVKDLYLDEIDNPRHLSAAMVDNYMKTVLKIRDTILYNKRKFVHATDQNISLKGFLSDEQEAAIERTKKRGTNGTAVDDDD